MEVIIKEDKIYVKSDYSSEFVKEARKLNGKWNGEAWGFDAEDEEMVRNVLMKVYGEDGIQASEKVKIELTLDEEMGKLQEIEMFGRVLVRRPSRDSEVRFHDGVLVKSGGFESKGGSVKHPRLYCSEGTVLIVKNVPINLLDKVPDEYKDKIKIIDKKIDKEALLKEKELLLKRLSEIEELLK